MVKINSLTWHMNEPWAQYHCSLADMNGTPAEIGLWCETTLHGKWKAMPDEYWPSHLYIELEQDAILIKLRW